MVIACIRISITTDSAANSGTDGSVYLGIAGREFCCDTSADDRETGDVQEYIFGYGHNVTRPAANDPNDPPLDLAPATIDKFPVYLRFESDNDHWAIRRAQMIVNNQPSYEFLIPNNASPLWLGPKSGKIVYLKKHDDGIPVRDARPPHPAAPPP